MTVKELIEELSKYDESCDVNIAIRIFGYESICKYYWIEKVRNDSDNIELVCDDYS